MINPTLPSPPTSSPLIQFLRHLHGLLDRKAQLAEGVLLKLGGDERRHGIALALFPRDLGDAVGRFLEVLADGHGVGLVGDLDLLAVLPGEAGGEDGGNAAVETRYDRPVLLGHEGLDLAVTLADQTQGHGLNPPGGKAAAHFVPEDGRDLVADQTVQNAPRLLRVHLLNVQFLGVLEGLLDGGLGDFVKDHALELRLALGLLAAQFLGQVPADGLSLAIGVGGQEDFIRILGRLLELVHDLLAGGQDFVVDFETLFDIDAQFALGQIPDVAHGSLHRVALPQILVYGPGFGG